MDNWEGILEIHFFKLYLIAMEKDGVIEILIWVS